MIRSISQMPALIDRLPSVRGTYTANASLSEFTWFRVGGPAEVLYRPADSDDLENFLKSKSEDIPLTVIGLGSNLLIRDGGIPGVVIRLGRTFANIEVLDGGLLRVGASVPDAVLARVACVSMISGLEFLRGIPGSIGGALRMNAGSYGREIKDIFIEARGLNSLGKTKILTTEDMGFSYRHTDISDDFVFVEALFQGEPGNKDEISARMDEVMDSRDESQPVRDRTGGSTFKNPDPELSGGRKAWELIDAAGCRGLTVGGAKVSELHCNFLVNVGNASARDLEMLGEDVRRRVMRTCGVELEWEIKRIGVPMSGI